MPRGDPGAAVVAGARVLPDDRGGERNAGLRVPEDDRLPLVRHAEAEHRLAGRRGDRLGHDPADVVPDLQGVVLHPSGPGKELGVLAICGGHRAAGRVEEEAARSGRPLVDRGEEGHRGQRYQGVEL